jgi:ATP-binding cassette, subfamily B, bacterial
MTLQQIEIPWQKLPFSLIAPDQHALLEKQAEQLSYTMGETINAVGGGSVFWVTAGKVRLREAVGEKSIVVLSPGDWFGGLVDPASDFKVVAADKKVEVIRWDIKFWGDEKTPELEQFWQGLQTRYQLLDRAETQPIKGYPYLASENTAAACLAMVAQYQHSPVPIENIQRQLRQQKPTDVMAAGEKIGLQLRRVQADWSDLPQLDLPALLRWQDSHWVVLYGVKGNRVIVANPLSLDQTCTTISRKSLEDSWDGGLWLATPLAKPQKFNLSWFMPAVWQYRGLLTEVLLASFILQILGLTTPILTQVIIDKAMIHESQSTLDVMAIALLGVALFQSLLGILRLFIFSHTANRLDLNLSAQLFRHLMRLPLSYFETRRVGDTVARAQELEEIRQFLTGTALTVVIDSFFSIICLGMMFFYSITLSWVALAVIPFFALLTLAGTPLLRRWLNETFNRGADSQSFLVETITGVHAVKAHAAEYVTRDRWEGLFARYIRMSFKASTASNIASNIGDFLTNFSYLVILWVGARLVMERKLTVGELVAFQMLSGKVTEPLLRLVQLWQEFQQVLLSVDRLGDIFNAPPEAASGSGVILPKVAGKVEFDKVQFRYKEGQAAVLKGISFTAEPGMFVGVVGRSGSGKSTLSKLLQRMYEPESGRILVDGLETGTVDTTSLRQQIGVVLQEDFLFNASISENIAFGNPQVTPDRIIQAAKLAAAHDFIGDLAEGYETNVGERGVALSGGQRQRIALARAFLARSPVLLLDEATSNLDSETEQRVLQNIQEVFAGHTVFMIAHRFAPLKTADLILVLDKGIIAERGTHEELLRQRGIYCSLYQRQQADV